MLYSLSFRKTSQLDKQLFFDFYGVSLLSDQYLESNPYASQYKDMIVQQVKEVYVPLITKMVYNEWMNNVMELMGGSWKLKREFGREFWEDFWWNKKKIKDLTLEQLAQIYNEGRWEKNYGGKPWGHITESLIQLINTTDTNQLITIIDHINDIQHNTGLMFHDFPKVEKWFSDALDIKAQATPEQLILYLSSDLQKFVTEDLQLRGQEVVAPEEYLTITDKIKLAESSNTSPETLSELAKDENVAVRRRVALNRSTLPETLIELTKDEDRYVCWSAKDSLKALKRMDTLSMRK